MNPGPCDQSPGVVLTLRRHPKEPVNGSPTGALGLNGCTDVKGGRLSPLCLSPPLPRLLGPEIQGLVGSPGRGLVTPGLAACLLR